jgi:hypothetical protein
VDVVGLTVQFEQFAAPTGAASFGDLPEAIQHFGIYALPSTLRA